MKATNLIFLNFSALPSYFLIIFLKAKKILGLLNKFSVVFRFLIHKIEFKLNNFVKNVFSPHFFLWKTKYFIGIQISNLKSIQLHDLKRVQSKQTFEKIIKSSTVSMILWVNTIEVRKRYEAIKNWNYPPSLNISKLLNFSFDFLSHSTKGDTS